ncbi:MAG: MATE family efflux transporter [Clostridia bacterium]|nr:MATE family efflux transporter [Clostridia bacterium]
MKKLTEGNIWKNFILFAIPLVLSGLLSRAYTMIDTMIAGHYLGEVGLAAIGATSSVIDLVSSIFAGYMVGFGMYIARLFGENQNERIYRGVWAHFGFCTVLVLIVSSLAVVFCDPILRFLNVDATFWEDAKTYFIIYISGFVIFMFNSNAIYLLGAFGDSSFPFYMSILSAVLNIGGNILSVTVLELGIVGIAFSSVLSAAVSTGFYIWRYRKLFKKLLPNGCQMKWSLKETKRALPYSIPPIFQQGAMYISGLVLSPMVNSFGESAIASYVVSSQILSLVNTMYYNSSRTVSNYTAQCLGCPFEANEKRRRLRKGVMVGLVQSIAFMLLMLIPCLIFPEFIASVFFSEGSAAESISLTVYFERVFLPFALFNVVNNMFHGIFRATKAKSFLIFSTVFSSVVRIAVSYPLTAMHGVNGFWAGMAISWIAEVLLLLVIYTKNWWLPKELRPVKASK